MRSVEEVSNLVNLVHLNLLFVIVSAIVLGYDMGRDTKPSEQVDTSSLVHTVVWTVALIINALAVATNMVWIQR